ncbi:ligase-associated DNA damage response DEXH box helicase [Zunongwangia profunda]|uniref:ligase-associated DNA damage response DEXH box helicase n=1 Tax=Zunongwangia profunda TaxID=398743 RepID=UPI000C89542C|nr:ligase-associated DNA damage response DEXH box helicase [Zunongwangia profunda]MAC64829.1 DNA ligase-associated DEXH box helicase [Flavobacteriaceae bacterium]MCC4227387.1 ligase-associated DNA damage response DEXH box helicase [Zunongwangia profunda]HAJ81172.1 DNA ligase-associated DEXH box helicase [Zunongwangia profunda]|tara:strand:+ start:1640 stop:4108 length:2469 start_codon:yes stop_codon:yes gene_type:complete
MTRQELLKIAQSWFTEQGWKPFKFQKDTWKAYLQKKNGLLNAPTGSGKTYALWVPIVLNYIKNNPDYKIRSKKGLKAIWITPLRALSVEIEQAAERFARGLGTNLTVGIRTGDTSQKERAAQKKSMPDLLITTPESLQLLLSSKNYDKTFENLEAIVVDEWHELLGSKRGVQVELALSRLKTVSKNLRIWGISATIGNLQQAREVLLGPKSEALQNSELIRANLKKKIKVKSIIPETMENFPWRGHMGLHLLDEVVPIIKSSKTTLLFTNTRSQCELWFQKIISKYPEFAGELAMHHGSINKETRLWVEQAIRNESLKAVVCTSSLDLGVDFAPVETIIQIGGPKGVARFLQRAGRSGHQPGKESVIYFLPTHAIELIEASALQKAVEKKAVEDRIPYLLSFDVLVQYLTTLAVSNGFFPKDIYPEIKSTFCFQAMTEDDWRWLLNFITKGSQSLQAYDEYKKVEIEEDGRFKVNHRGVAMRHRLQIGTIVSDAMLSVKYMKGGYIGTIEEWFISKLTPGDIFTFAGRNLELVRIKNMQVLVKKSKKKTAKVPSWMGGRMTFSAQMSELLREEMYLASEYDATSGKSEELSALTGIFDRQKKESVIPKSDEFLIETFKTREGYHAIFYPFEGRFVHEALGSLLAYRVSLLSPISFSIAFNDYGFELLSDQEIDMQQVLDNNLFSAEFLMDDLYKSLNATEMARRKFRDIAVIAGLVFTGYPNKLVKSKHLQSSSQLLFSVFRDYEEDNLLYLQSFRETFEHQLEEGRLRQALERINNQKMIWRNCEKPTPFSFPIITDRLREKLSSEKLEDRIRKMMKSLDS